MAINKEIWIDLLKEGFYPKTDFLADSQDMSAFVEYNKINLAEAGIEPNVLMDNTTFPVPVSERDDTPLELILHTFDTENTVVRSIDEMETAYAKMDSVVRQHREALRKKSGMFAAHSWCPASDSEFTPVAKTSGTKSNKKGLIVATFEDFLDLEARFLALDIDPSTLVLVINPTHLADLRAEDLKLYKEVMQEGKLFNMKMYQYSKLPYFTISTGVKKAFGSVPGATESMASIVYSNTEVMRADGDVTPFLTEKDPGARGDIIGFQKRFTALPIRGKCIGALYSDKELEA